MLSLPLLNQKIPSVQRDIINRPRKASSPISERVLRKHLYIQFVTDIDETVHLTPTGFKAVCEGGG